MPGFRGIWPTILALLAAPASAAVTPEQAQTLPVAELARLVLGEAGALVAEVDRPEWPVQGCGPGCPPPPREQPKGWPPLDRLTFYGRPAMAWSSSGWRGLCEVQVITVSFGAGGEVNGIGFDRRWASPFGMERVPAGATLADLPDGDGKCRSGGDPRTFFESDGPIGLTAFRVLVAARLFAEAAERGGRLPFRFKCKSAYFDCGKEAARTVAQRIGPSYVRNAEQVDCADRSRKLSSLLMRACYRVELRDVGESLFLELVEDSSDVRIERLEYLRGLVIID